MSRRLGIVVLLLVFLPGCSLIPFVLPERDYVVGDIRLEDCPDFDTKNCTVDYPSTIEGLSPKEAKSAYRMLHFECSARYNANQDALMRCREFK